jgi:hypothetical protein
MHSVLDYFSHNSDRMLLIYGEWDPWIKGRLVISDVTDSGSFVQPEGTHGSSIAGLRPVDHETSLALLKKWTGVTPRSSSWRRADTGTDAADPPEPRMRPVPVHAPSPAR